MAEVSKSGNADIDGILWGYKWDTANLTFSFPGNAEQYEYEQINGFQAFNAAQIASAKRALADIASFSGLTFQETGQPVASLDFAGADSVQETADYPLETVDTAQGTPPDPAFRPNFAFGDMWFNHTNYNAPELGSFAFSSGIMHELGHALGLKHGHRVQIGHDEAFPALPANHNSFEYSVMTYDQYVGDPYDADSALDHPTGYMQNDIAALQYMYGANYDFRNGNTKYRWDGQSGEMLVNGQGQGAPQSNFILQTVWDGGGTDTYDFSNYSFTDLEIDLAPGAWTALAEAQLADLGAIAGQHLARGNIANAQLYQGNLASLIENATGGSGDDNLRGNEATNTLKGGLGDDYLDGREGLDVLEGGSGDDIYHLDDVNPFFNHAVYDIVKEGFNGGTDFVSVARTTVDGETVEEYALDYYIENAGVAGTGAFELIGNDLANRLTGNGSINALQGGGGGDVLNGLESRDYLRGGAGDDTYVLNDITSIWGLTSFDSVIEEFGQGIDTVEIRRGATGEIARGFYTLAANVENGIVTGTAAFDLAGNELANLLTGNAAANVLEGAEGNDTIDGGLGIDTADYSGMSASVDVTLSATAAASVKLGDVAEDTVLGIENLIGGTGGDHLVAMGLDFVNILDGAGGDDRINGGGGSDKLLGAAGADTILGGNGNDTLSGGALDDVLSGQVGNDVLGGAGGNDSLAGGAGADKMFGNNGADSLTGGAGSDDMAGGNGADSFTFNLAAWGGDTVADFEDGLDTLRFLATIAGDVSDFTITGNGTADVTLAIGAQSLDLHGAAAITITNDDFAFLA